MRITHRNQIMSHMRNMNNTLTNLTNSNNRMSSQRKFDHAYEDVADATRAMRLRKNIRDKDFYMKNIRDARGRINSAEDALQTSVNILRTTTDRLEQALNGTYDQTDRQIIANEVKDLQKEVLALMNSSYTDHFVFDAAGGPVKGEQPFTEGMATVPTLVDGTFTTYQLKTGKELFDAQGNLVQNYSATSESSDPLVNVFYTSKEAALAQDTRQQVKLDMSDPADWGTYFEEVATFNTQVQKMEAITENVGGVSTVVGYKPVSSQVGPTLLYHGMPVDQMKYEVDGNGKKTGNILWYNYDPEEGTVKNDPTTGTPYKMPYNATNYVDIGLGHKFQNTATGETINPETVLQYTFSGVEVFGFGTANNGLSNNLYTFMGQVAKSMEENDLESLGEQLNHMSSIRTTLLIGLTEIGTRSNFIDDMEGIHKNDKLSYQTRQTDIEAVDLAEEAIYNKNHEMAWMVTLQLGSKVLPSSMFDFIR